MTDIESAVATVERLTRISQGPVQQGKAFFLWQAGENGAGEFKDRTDAVERAQTSPYRLRGTLTALSLESFTGMTHRYGGFSAPVFVCPKPNDGAIFVSVLNDEGMSWRDHRVKFHLKHSPEAKAWLAINGKDLSQQVFAEFLEDNAPDLSEESAGLVDLAARMQARNDIEFESAVRLDNGATILRYSENIKATLGKEGVEVPREFSIGIRLFENHEAAYLLRARLKYRLHGKVLTFRYEFIRLDRVFDDALNGIIEGLKDRGMTVFLGYDGQ